LENTAIFLKNYLKRLNADASSRSSNFFEEILMKYQRLKVLFSIFLCSMSQSHHVYAVCYDGNPIYPFPVVKPLNHVEYYPSFDYSKTTYTPSSYHNNYFLFYPAYTTYYHDSFIGSGHLHSWSGSPHHSECDRRRSHCKNGEEGEEGEIIVLAFVAAIVVVGVGWLAYKGGKAGYHAYQKHKVNKKKKYERLQHNKLLAVLSDAYDLPNEVTAYHSMSTASEEEAANFKVLRAYRGKALKSMHEFLVKFRISNMFDSSCLKLSVEELAALLREANENGALCKDDDRNQKYFGYHEIKSQIRRGFLQSRVAKMRAVISVQ
jgi:hypothetical protein